MELWNNFLESWNSLNIPTWSVVTFGTLFIYYKYSTWNFGFFKKLGVKGPQPYPVVGTLIPMFRSGIWGYDTELRQKYGSVVGTFTGRIPVMMIFDVNILKQILVKDFSNFTNRFDIGISDYPLKKMLLTLKDEHWKHVRNHVTPTFSSGKLRKMNRKMLYCVGTFVSNLEKLAESKEIFDFRQICGAFTMDVIASTAFGLQIDSHNDPKNQFVRMANKVFEFSLTSVRMLIIFFFPFLMKPLGKLGLSPFPKETVKFFVSAVDQAMNERRGIENENVDFLQLMINSELEDEENLKRTNNDSRNSDEAITTKRKGLSHEEILAQSILFFLAGYETTANTLSLFGYCLAVNPDIQERLINEIDEVMKDHQQVSYDVIKKMPYLDMCLSEVMRCYPAGPRSDRVAKEDIVINGLLIPKGTVIGIPIYGIHKDPELWPDPEKFDPERFSPESKEMRDQFAYMPFGIGPRNCVGMRLALTEMKMAIVCILQKLKFVACEETQIPLKFQGFKMQGVNGIKIRMEKRVNVNL